MLHVDATEAIHYDNTLLLFVNDGIIIIIIITLFRH